MKNFLIIMAAVSFILAAGCADVKAPTPKEMITEPLGATQVKVGMSRSEVESLLGDPDIKQAVTSKMWSGQRVEWFYKGRYTSLPVGADYLSEDLYLYFDGDNLTNISRKPLGRAVPDVEDIK